MQSVTEIYLESFKAICPDLSDNEASDFVSKVTFQELNKKDFYLEADKIQKSVGFIAKGLVRSFFIDNDGDEITVGFYPEGEYATHYPAFITQTPSKYFIQCLEPTTFVNLSFEDLQWMYQQSPVFEKYGRLIAEKVLVQQQARIESFIFENAEERYLAFTKKHPTLFNRISLSHLCSFLGIERQTLTRIRQKIAHQ